MTEERRSGEDRRAGTRGGGRRSSDRSRAIASRVSAELYRRRMTHRKLAVLAGIDERTVRNLLDGKDCTLHTLEGIAAALEIDLVALVAA